MNFYILPSITHGETSINHTGTFIIYQMIKS